MTRQKIHLFKLNNAKRTGRHKNCLFCGKPFYAKKSVELLGGAKFCSVECRNIGHRKPALFSCRTCGENFIVSRGELIYRTPKYCSRKCYFIKNRGENSHLWRGGGSSLIHSIRNTPQYKKWQYAINKRDKGRCCLCGRVKRNRVAHHIEYLSNIIKRNKIKTIEESIRFGEICDINNGVIMCKTCHNRLHQKGNQYDK